MRAGIFAVFLQNGKGPRLSVAGRPFEIFSAVSIIAGWGNSDASGVQIVGLWNERVAGIFEVGGVDRLSGWQSVSPPAQAELGRGTPGCGESALLKVRGPPASGVCEAIYARVVRPPLCCTYNISVGVGNIHRSTGLFQLIQRGSIQTVLLLGLSVLLIIPNRTAVLPISIADVNVMAVRVCASERVVLHIAV